MVDIDTDESGYKLFYRQQLTRSVPTIYLGMTNFAEPTDRAKELLGTVYHRHYSNFPAPVVIIRPVQ
jgi:hypothetical protein